MVAWPSGLRRWFKAPVSSEAWVRIPPLPEVFFRPSRTAKVSGALAKWKKAGLRVPSRWNGTALQEMERLTHRWRARLTGQARSKHWHSAAEDSPAGRSFAVLFCFAAAAAAASLPCCGRGAEQAEQSSRRLGLQEVRGQRGSRRRGGEKGSCPG